jgi:hypothetical protein
MPKSGEQIRQERWGIEGYAPIPIDDLPQPIDYLGEIPDWEHGYYIYALGLEDGCYYVGLARRPLRRIATHLAGRGPVWTREHRPLAVTALYGVRPPDGAAPVSSRSLAKARLIEEWVTFAYFVVFGRNRVSGAVRVNRAFEQAPPCPRTNSKRRRWHSELEPKPPLPGWTSFSLLADVHELQLYLMSHPQSPLHR